MQRSFRRLFLALLLMVSSLQAAPEFPNGSLVMDDEATEIISDWVQQIFNVANLNHVKPQIYIIADPEINAAAIPGGRLIIHTGLLLEAKHVGQFLGVLAHEVGHIAGGHRSPVDAALQEAMIPAAIALLIGGLTAIITQDPTALVAGFMGGSHVMERTLLRFSRHQESSADQAAFIYLEKLNWPAHGFLELFQTIHRKSTLGCVHLSKN